MAFQHIVAQFALARRANFCPYTLVAPILLFVLCCGFCWKLVLCNQYTWIDNPDLVNMDVPRLQFQQVAWRNQQLPLWDPHLWCGQPFLGQIVGAAFPLNWPLFLLKPNAKGRISYRQLNWYFVMLHFFGALFACWLCRDLGTSRFASIFGGFVFSFSSFFAVTPWPEVLGGLVVVPLVLLFLLRTIKREHPISSAALCGMFLGLAWLSGHHEIPIYLSVTVACVWLYDFCWHRAEWPRGLALAVVSLLFAILTSGLQTIPGYEYAKVALRWVGADQPVEWSDTIPYRVHASYSIDPSSWIAVVVPWGGHNSEAFIGIVALTLVCISVISSWHMRWVRLFGCIGLAGILLSMGGWNWFHGLLYTVLPLFQKARNPDRLLSLYGLAVAVLSAFGLDSLRANPGSPVIKIIVYVLMAVSALIAATALVAPAFQRPGPDNFASMLGIISLLLAATLLGARRKVLSGRSVILVVLALATVELGNLNAPLYRDRTPQGRETLLRNLTEYSDLASFLRKEPAPARVNVLEVTDGFNFGDWEGIDTLNGYGAGVTKNLWSLDWPSVRTQNLLAVGYSISKQPPRGDQQLIYQSSSGASVFRNVDALPRARIVHRIETISSAKELAARIDDSAFDARITALMMNSAPTLESCSGEESAVVAERTLNSVVVEAHAACRGLLVLADTWYPGWTATIDNRGVPIYQAYLALRGVVVERGTHRVEFRFRPLSVSIGTVMSALGVIGACAIVLWDRRRFVSLD